MHKILSVISNLHWFCLECESLLPVPLEKDLVEYFTEMQFVDRYKPVNEKFSNIVNFDVKYNGYMPCSIPECFFIRKFVHKNQFARYDLELQSHLLKATYIEYEFIRHPSNPRLDSRIEREYNWCSSCYSRFFTKNANNLLKLRIIHKVVKKQCMDNEYERDGNWCRICKTAPLIRTMTTLECQAHFGHACLGNVYAPPVTFDSHQKFQYEMDP